MRAVLQLGAVALATAATAVAAYGQDKMPWQPNLETAQRVAADTNRLVLIHFWAPWCGPCRRLDREVFSRAETAKGLEANFVLVKLNADQARAKTRLYGVSTVPTDVITTATGQMVSQIHSPPTSAQYVAQMNQAAAGHRSLARKPQRSGTQQNAGSAGPPAAGPAGPPAQPAANSGAGYGQPYPPATAPPVSPTQPPPAVAQAAAASGDRYAEYFPQQPSAATQPAAGANPVTPAQAYSAVPSSAATSQTAIDPYAVPAGSAPPTVNPFATPTAPATTTAGPPATSPAGPTTVANPYAAPAAQPPAASPYGANAPAAQPPAANPYATPPAQQPSASPYAAPSPAANPYAAPTAQPPAANPYAAPTQPPAANPYAAATQPPAANPYAAGPPAGQPHVATAPYTQPAVPTTSPTTAVSNPPQLPPGCPPIGLDGNCPVTLVERKRWIVGHASYGVVHRGRTYLFLGPQEKKKFLADPDRYSPVLSGIDPVLALDNQMNVPGRREFGVFGADGLIYLFADEKSRARFEANEQAYAARAKQASQTQYQARRPGP